MNKTKTLTMRIDQELRREIEFCAHEDEASVSAIAATALRLFCERRRRERRRQRDVKKALRAFKTICGAVSHGSLAQNIDERLYGRGR